MSETPIVNPEFNFNTFMCWESAIELLSLDRVASFWDDIGLSFKYSDQVKALFRDCITRKEELFACLDPSTGDCVTPGTMLHNKLLADINKLEGPERCASFYRWLEHDYCPLHPTPPGWESEWDYILGWIPQYGWGSMPSVGLSEALITRLMEIADCWIQTRDQVCDKIERAKEKPLSEWDAHWYQWHSKNAEIEVELLDTLENYLRASAFRKCWQQVQEAVNAKEMEMLSRWGEMMLQIRGIDPSGATLPLPERTP
jgi:hypothetical protein